MIEINAPPIRLGELGRMDAVSRSPRRLVVIDDDVQLLHSMRFALETEGYAVTTFASGEEALQSRFVDDPTCLIVDQRLPGLSGMETISRLRLMGVAAPAILVTSNPSNLLRRRAARARWAWKAIRLRKFSL